MDLSWPPGQSGNSGIAKDHFMGFYAKFSFPTIDVITRRISRLQGDIYLFKIDLSGYFRQLNMDPGDYSLLCFTWNGLVYFDVVSPMGLRSAPYFAQCTSNAIRHIHNRLNYFLFNYIDDFIGIEVHSKVWDSYNTLHTNLGKIGIKESSEKRVEPTQQLNCIGNLVDAKNKTMKVLPGRVAEILQELDQWSCRYSCMIKDVQRLGGKLQFICTVIRPGRIFLS